MVRNDEFLQLLHIFMNDVDLLLVALVLFNHAINDLILLDDHTFDFLHLAIELFMHLVGMLFDSFSDRFNRAFPFVISFILVARSR